MGRPTWPHSARNAPPEVPRLIQPGPACERTPEGCSARTPAPASATAPQRKRTGRMDKLIQMLVIGVILGSIYGFIAVGMVLVYRTTNVLNIAHGGIGILSAFMAWDLIVLRRYNFYVGVTIGILFAALLGFFFEWFIIRRLAGQPALQTGTTLALYILLQGVSGMPDRWTKLQFQILPSPLINKGFRVPRSNNQLVTYDQLVL